MDKTQRNGDSSGPVFRNYGKAVLAPSYPWIPLPAEIRLMILEEVVNNLRCHRGWSSYATVCQEWLVFIEQKNFQRLMLDTSRLEGLNRVVTRQRPFVQHILLCIDLPTQTYGSLRHEFEGATEWTSDCRNITKDAIKEIFSVLSTWNSTDHPGLVLELGSVFLRPIGQLDWWLETYARRKNGNLFGHELEISSGPSEPLPKYEIIDPPILETLARNHMGLSSSDSPESWRSVPVVQAITGITVHQELQIHISPSLVLI